MTRREVSRVHVRVVDEVAMIRNLIDAAEADDVEEVKYWVKKGALLDKSVPGGFTALHGATRKGHKNMVKALLKLGASVDIKTTKDETPLHMAAFHGQLDCAKVLVRAGANLRARTSKQKLPLDLAIQRKHDDVADYLEEDAEEEAKVAKKLLKTSKQSKSHKSHKSKKKHKKKSGDGSAALIFPFLIFVLLLMGTFS